MALFSEFTFPVTGGTTERTLPDRLKDVRNIRDYGATGDGVTDDRAAIQAAVDWNSVVLTVAAMSPFVPSNAIRATCTATLTANALTSLTIGNIGDHYVPSRVYTIALSGGGGTGATATATANGSGLINQASLAVTAGGSGYTTPPTCTIEYPGHVTTLTFDSVPANLTDYDSQINVLSPATAIIRDATVVTSVNVGAGTAVLTSYTDTSVLALGSSTAVVMTANLQVGDRVRFCRSLVGPVYVPPGTYRVSAPIIFTGHERSFSFYGDGNISRIIGDFNDFVIKRQVIVPTSQAQSGTRRVEKLYIENEHATGGGIIMANSVGLAVHDCTIVANRGINTLNMETIEGSASWGSFEGIVTNCDFSTGGNRAGSYAMYLFHDGPTLNCRVINFEKGWIHVGGQGGQIVAGCYFELCDLGCRQGTMINGTDNSPALPHAIVGNHFKNCGTAVRDPRYTFGGNYIEAAQGAFSGDSQYGVLMADDKSANSIIGGNYITGFYDVGSIYAPLGPGTVNRIMFVSNRVDTNTGGGVTWRAPTGATAGVFIENNVAVTYLFNNLPPNTVNVNRDERIEGVMFDITNGSTAVWGAPVASGGSNHIKVRWNNTNWTVVGK